MTGVDKGGTLFAGIGNGGTGTSIGGGRGSGPSSPPASSAPLSSSEIISMIKKGTGSTSTGTGGSLKQELLSSMGASTRDPVVSIPSTTSKPPRKEDDLGMEGLAERIRAAHNGPASSLALGLDSEAIITALTNAASALDDAEESAPTTGGTVMLSRAFTSPWAEIGGGSLPGRRTQTSLEAILPACYNVQAPPHAATRLASFTEEALFYMFYGMPRDRMQEMAARELTLNRGWRYHKELRLWLLPSSATPTASSMTAGISALRMSPLPTTPKEVKSPGMETAHDTASYVVFDPNTWSKIRRELPFIKEALLEDRFTASSPSSLASPLPK